MKSRAEYRTRRKAARIDAYRMWSKLERNQFYNASTHVSKDAFIARCANYLRRQRRLQYYIKKHGIILDDKRYKKGELRRCPINQHYLRLLHMNWPFRNQRKE